MYTFELNHPKHGRAMLLGVSIAVVLILAAVTVYMMAFAATDPDSWLHVAVPLLGAAALGVGFVVLTKASASANTAFRVAIGEDGLWLGEQFFGYEDLAAVELTSPEAVDVTCYRLVLQNRLGRIERFDLGRTRGGEASEKLGDYRQFALMLRNTLAKQPAKIEFFEVDAPEAHPGD